MLKVRLIIYIVLLAVIIFFLGRFLRHLPEKKEGQQAAPSVETGSKEILLSAHMVLARYEGDDPGGKRFRVVRYLKYELGEKGGSPLKMEFVLPPDVQGEWAGMAADLKKGQGVLLCWNEVSMPGEGADGKRVERVAALKPLTESEEKELEGDL